MEFPSVIQCNIMIKRIMVIITALICMAAFTLSASATRTVWAYISEVSRNEDNKIIVTICIRNEKDKAVDGFALYDAVNHRTKVYFAEGYIDIGKFLKVKVPARTQKKIRITYTADIEDISEYSYKLYYSCWAGDVYCYGRVEGESKNVTG